MERQTAAIQKEKEAFQQEALDLAKRLEAVIHDKFIPKSHIDADTPIDKTLNFLHAFVAVRTYPPYKLCGRSHSAALIGGVMGLHGNISHGIQAWACHAWMPCDALANSQGP